MTSALTKTRSRTGRWRSVREQHGDAEVAAFPLGGIGTGNVSIGARGEFRDWEIANRPDKGNSLPFTFFAVRAAPSDGEAVTRVLESRIRPPYEGDEGLRIGKVAGLPRLRETTMRGEYPLLTIDFDDDVLPVGVQLLAFTPLVPLDTNASGLPAAVLRYRVHNPTDGAVEVSIAGSMSNPIGYHGRSDYHHRLRFEGTPTVRRRDGDGLIGLEFGTDLPTDHLLFGSVVLQTTAGDGVSMTPQWPVGQWQDGVQLFWDRFCADGRLQAAAAFTLDEDPEMANLSKQRVGSLAITHSLEAGETRDFEFVLAWHTPNRPRAWFGHVGAPNTHGDETVRNHYASRFPDAWAVGAHLKQHRDDLEASTKAFHDALFGSTLPPELVDAVTSTLVALRSTTCFLLEDGSKDGLFAAWEGSFDHAGSCEGTCTHVWNYAQTVANLFPSLERSARRTEFLHETLEDGRMRFRTNSVFGNEPLEYHPAVDGQLGTVVRLFREWRFSGDDAFLKELWPAAKRATDFAFRVWDANSDFVLDSQQHNTYDIEFYGENSLANSMFFAALRAMTAMAAHLGDADAERYRDAAETGSRRMDEMLYNGEYYEQRLEDVNSYRYQYGDGCLSDQLLGQTFAHLTGLGHVLPADHVRSAVSAVFKHNFRNGFDDYHSVQRTYVLNDERGLVLCSWPRGGRPRIPFVYSDEVWTGIEYQVATHLVYEGLVEEGLDIVRAVRERHDGVRRNPWNEVECGNHYARSMASWGVLLALTGTQWDGGARTLRLAPHEAGLDGNAFRSFFSTARGWGSVVVKDGSAQLQLLWGELDVEEVTVVHPREGHFSSGPARVIAGETLSLAPVAVSGATGRN